MDGNEWQMTALRIGWAGKTHTVRFDPPKGEEFYQAYMNGFIGALETAGLAVYPLDIAVNEAVDDA